MIVIWVFGIWASVTRIVVGYDFSSLTKH